MATPKQLIKRTGGKTARIDVTPAGLAVIRDMAAGGNDHRTIAKRLGIGYQTLRDMQKRGGDVDDALAAGHAELADTITSELLKQGKAGYAPALMFLAKARLGWREGDAPETKPSITIVLPDAKSPDAYLASIAEANAKALPPIAPKGITLQPAPDDDNQTVVYSG
jgi:hypothetical protein